MSAAYVMPFESLVAALYAKGCRLLSDGETVSIVWPPRAYVPEHWRGYVEHWHDELAAVAVSVPCGALSKPACWICGRSDDWVGWPGRERCWHCEPLPAEAGATSSRPQRPVEELPRWHPKIWREGDTPARPAPQPTVRSRIRERSRQRRVIA